MLRISAPGSLPRPLGNVGACDYGAILVSTLRPSTGAGIDAAGRVPHLEYRIALSAWEPSAGAGTVFEDSVSLLFDVGVHVLPFPGTISLVGGVGEWVFDCRILKIGPDRRFAPAARWLRTYVGGGGGAPAAFTPPDWHTLLAASEYAPLVDNLGGALVVDHVPIAMPQGLTFTSRYPIYMLSAVEF